MANFVLLDISRPEVAIVVAAMVQAREAVGRRTGGHPQEPTGEASWADVLADPRARLQPRVQSRGALTIYHLRDVQQPIVLVACSKCDWRAAFSRDGLIAAHGADQPLPDLLDHLAAPGCPRLGSGWDCCGVHYVEPIEAG
jgi:hypothetical protein